MGEPANKGRTLPGEVLAADEVSALIRTCGRGPSGIRNAALIAAMFGAALRVSEALALRPSDLDPGRGMVRVRHGKGTSRYGSGTFSTCSCSGSVRTVRVRAGLCSRQFVAVRCMGKSVDLQALSVSRSSLQVV